MNARELRELSLEELNDKHKTFKEEIFNLRFQHVIWQLGNTGRIGDVKKSIAKVLTVMREKEIGLKRPV